MLIGQSTKFENQEGNSWIPFQQPKPILTVNIQEYSNYWHRSYSTDLPEYVTSLTIVVENVGDGSAENIEVTVSVDGSNLSYDTISLLQPREQYSNSVTLTLTYDSSKTVSTSAICPSDSKSTSLLVQAPLPRFFDDDIAKLYVTPEESSVVNLKNQILDDKFFLTPNWMALEIG